MQTRSMLLIGLALVGAFALGNTFAQTSEQEPPQMPEWIKPTKEHQELQQSCGEFTVKGEYFPAPGAPSMPMNGTATRESILNGYFVKEVFKADWMGMPFEGLMIQGYDTLGKQYQSIWVDNVSPYMAYMQSTVKDEVMTSKFYSPDPMTGKMIPHRSTMTGNKDEHVVTMYITEGDAERMTMRMTYTRKK